MPLVDRDDDSVQRYVVWHYRHDPSPDEWRNVIVDPYDNEVEFVDAIRRLTEELDQTEGGAGRNRALEFLGRL